MDLAQVFAIAAGSSVVTAIVTVIGNGIFGWAKGRADVAGLYNRMAADTAVRNRELVGAIERLTDAVDKVSPLLDRLASQVGDQESLVLRRHATRLREANSAARQAI